MKTRTKALLAGLTAVVVGLIYKKVHRPKVTYTLANAGNCPRCQTLYQVKAGMTFFFHLLDDHGLDADSAETELKKAYSRLLAKVEKSS